MAHARRRFHDHWVHSESPMAEEALGYIKSFYAFEARIRDLDIEQRTALRQRELKPQVDAFFTWLGLNGRRWPTVPNWPKPSTTASNARPH